MKLFILMFLSIFTYAEIVTPEQLFIIRNENTGIKEYEHNIKDDNFSVDLSYTMNPNPIKTGDISGYRMQITMHRPVFSWIAYYATTDAFIDKTTSITGNFDATQTLINFTEIGLGVSRRSNLISDFIARDDIYDEFSVIGSVTSVDSSVFSQAHSGYGLISSYGVFWRASRSIHLGLRASYHIHSIEDSNEKVNSEYSADWVSMSASFGFYL